METTVKTETSVVLRAKAGDVEARNQVVSEMDSMVSWVLNVVSWRGEREDGMQEGRIGVLEAIEKFDASKEAQFSTFAFYSIRKALQRAMKATPVPVEDIEETASESVDELEISEIRSLVGNLSDEDKALVVARFYEGKTLEEIGDSMGVHKYTVSLKITKILDGLKVRLS